jgi:Gnt-I system high-affinity gluconate transporter
MAIFITILSLITLVLLISWLRVNTFLAFMFVTLAVGLLIGLPPDVLMKAIQGGIGNTLGSLVSVIVLGSMLGKIISVSGAAQQVSNKIVQWVGVKHTRWAFMISGFIIGLPLFYAVGFMLLVPLAITVAYRNKLSAVYVSLPMLASLSVTQGYLPPHPAPLFLVHELKADMGLTLLYGIIISIPAILVSGALYGSMFGKIKTTPNINFISPELDRKELPSVLMSFFTILLPIMLIGSAAFIAPMLDSGNFVKSVISFLGDASISLLVTIIVAIFSLGVLKKNGSDKLNGLFLDAIKDVASIILIFGAAGALKQVLTDGGVTKEIAGYLIHSNINPYVLGWGIAAIIRVCVGSSTVAGITTAGFMLPLMTGSIIEPNLMVLAIGAGSMMFSHFNDTGFWLFREYFQLSLKDTLKTWTMMDTLVSFTGLIGVLLLSLVL